jgi:hypothetical protein
MGMDFGWKDYTKREKLELIATITLGLLLYLATVQTKNLRTGGQDDIRSYILGIATPKWALLLLGGIFTAPIYLVIRWIGRRVWPLPPGEEPEIEVPVTRATHDSELVPPISPASSAEEFLALDLPTPLEAVMLGLDWVALAELHGDAEEAWCQGASLEQLRSLVPTAEMLLREGKSCPVEIMVRLEMACRTTGLPSPDEIEELIRRLEQEGVPIYTSQR